MYLLFIWCENRNFWNTFSENFRTKMNLTFYFKKRRNFQHWGEGGGALHWLGFLIIINRNSYSTLLRTEVGVERAGAGGANAPPAPGVARAVRRVAVEAVRGAGRGIWVIKGGMICSFGAMLCCKLITEMRLLFRTLFKKLEQPK